jgi:hypothetical protein
MQTNLKNFCFEINEMFCVYDGRTTATGDQRAVFIDRMKILKDGRLVVEGPTTAPQALPSGVKKSMDLLLHLPEWN